MTIIDAHHHLWEFGRYDYGWITEGDGPLGRHYLVKDLEDTVKPCGVVGTVLVQTIHSLSESKWFCELANASDLIRGVVGWIDLASDRAESQLDELLACSEKLVGIRHVVQGEPDPDWVVRPEVIRGLRALERREIAYDLLFLPRHLRHVPALAEALPNLRMVIDHLAKPLIRDQLITGWDQDLAAAARYPNVFCKLSGMITEADHDRWTAEDLKPYVDHAVSCFGFERLMFGSDWPVCMLAGSYDRMIAALEDCVAGIGPEEKNRLFHETATRFYGLSRS